MAPRVTASFSSDLANFRAASNPTGAVTKNARNAPRENDPPILKRKAKKANINAVVSHETSISAISTVGLAALSKS